LTPPRNLQITIAPQLAVLIEMPELELDVEELEMIDVAVLEDYTEPVVLLDERVDNVELEEDKRLDNLVEMTLEIEAMLDDDAKVLGVAAIKELEERTEL